MNRSRILLLLGLAAISPVGYGFTAIDLDEPGAMARIEKQSPQLHQKIQAIIQAAEDLPIDSAPKVIQARFSARDVKLTYLLMTSDPPKRRLSFELDREHYITIITLRDAKGKLVPAK